jgi:phage terminase small subunit
MHSVGRRPTPAATTALVGRSHKKKDPTCKEPEVPAGAILCPMELSEEGKKEWDRITPTLEATGVLTKIDTTALAAYCECWSRWVEAEKMLREYGPVMKAPIRHLTQSP